MPDNKKHTILIVDDESFVRKVFGDIFKKRGYNVLLATNGQEGLSVMKREKPDMAILDILMPEMDGLKVLEEMKKQNLLKKIPVIILSAYSGPQYIDKALKLGASAYLGKADYQIEQILKKTKEILDGKK